ncbi:MULTISPECIES: PP2C family protein-serine/threonine phosphatase [Nocardiopsis]|jgi:serine/threonine protein phosphatase PrpC|uniref:Phosphatase n=1 Tax=Nocardiopsis alba TaxID=53437 RepID=A0A7K2ITF7_9ACTN|nr:MULTISPECIES: hypothetical protein [Nocardiopsis]MEC3893672.1 phosphatase [Nocardiopsis sp. LDBS1602]MYR33260.1 phosphatase [Nocardiopsis alba]
MRTPVIAADSDQGPRADQEDAHSHRILTPSEGWCASLADGFGDHPRTGEAAELAARTATEAEGSALDALRAASEAIARVHPGADCAMVHARQGDADDLVDIAWVGDCRVWTWSPCEGLLRHTRDHTQGQRMRDRGISDHLARIRDHALTRSVATVLPDDIGTTTAPAAELVLLTSDGVHDHVDELLLAELVDEHADTPEALARVLIEAAREGGSHDNATALVVRSPMRVSEHPSRQELILGGLDLVGGFDEEEPALRRLAEDRAVGIACDGFLSRDGVTYWCTKDSDHTDHHVSWHGVTWAESESYHVS